MSSKTDINVVCCVGCAEMQIEIKKFGTESEVHITLREGSPYII